MARVAQLRFVNTTDQTQTFTPLVDNTMNCKVHSNGEGLYALNMRGTQ